MYSLRALTNNFRFLIFELCINLNSIIRSIDNGRSSNQMTRIHVGIV